MRAENNRYSKLYERIIYFFKHNRCSTSEAMELSQESFLILLKTLDKGVAITNFEAYLYGIAKNKLQEHYRKIKKNRDIIDIDELYDGKMPSENPIELENEVDYEYYKLQSMKICFEKLSVEEQELLLDYVDDDKTVNEISNKLNIKPGSLRKRIYDLRQKLWQCYSERMKKKCI